MHRVDDARKLGREPVTGSLDDAAAMLRELRVAQLAPNGLQRRERAFLILAHQPRIAGDIESQDCHEPARDQLLSRSHGRDTTRTSMLTIVNISCGTAGRRLVLVTADRLVAGSGSPAINFTALVDDDGGREKRSRAWRLWQWPRLR
jgi:hypothetical protein